jgi:hypothetical protein
MSYKLFLDDERFPVGNDWKIVRSYHEAIECIQTFGMPEFMSLDHDLSTPETGYDFVQWLVEQQLDANLQFPSNFKFQVHSMNPVGAENIGRLLKNFLQHLEINKLYK